MSRRAVVGHATYRGPVEAAGQIVGPNGWGELLVAVEADQDVTEIRDGLGEVVTSSVRTRVGFAVATMDDVESRLQPDYARIAALFVPAVSS